MRCTGLAYTLQLQPISLQQMQQRRACQSVSWDVCIAALSGGLHRQQRQQPQRRKRLGWSIHQPTELRLVARDAPSAPDPIAPPPRLRLSVAARTAPAVIARTCPGRPSL